MPDSFDIKCLHMRLLKFSLARPDESWGFVYFQDIQKCLSIIDQVAELDVGANIIKKNPDIVQTVKKVIRK